MKNVFIVTLGSREIQFNKSKLESFGFTINEKKLIYNDVSKCISLDIYENTAYPEYLCHSFPRLAGETILNNLKIFIPVIEFPLIDSAFKEIISKEHPINSFILVYTDQIDLDVEDPKQRNNFNRDTVFYKSILEKTYKEKFQQLSKTSFSDIPIEEKVSDIDHQYNYFAGKCKVLFDDKENIENIFLLAQGGIDQINHALTLQLIQNFGKKVHLWQQSEIGEPKLLDFTKFFLEDLLKNQVASLVDYGEYYGAYNITKNFSNVTLNTLLEFCHLRKHFLFEEANKKINTGLLKIAPVLIDYRAKKVNENGVLKEFMNNSEAVFKVIERFYISELYFRIENYTEFVLCFQIFFETLVIQYLNSFFDIELDKNNTKYQAEGNRLIQELFKNNPSRYSQFLLKMGRKNNERLSLSFPVLALIAISKAEDENHFRAGSILKILYKINSMINGSSGSTGLDVIRNKIAHHGFGADLMNLYCSSIEKDKRNKKAPWQNYIEIIRKSLGIALDYNPYLELNGIIKAL